MLRPAAQLGHSTFSVCFVHSILCGLPRRGPSSLPLRADKAQGTDFVNSVTIRQILIEWQLCARHYERETWASIALRIKFKFLRKKKNRNFQWPELCLPCQCSSPLGPRTQVLRPGGPSEQTTLLPIFMASRLSGLCVSSLEMFSLMLCLFSIIASSLLPSKPSLWSAITGLFVYLLILYVLSGCKL